MLAGFACRFFENATSESLCMLVQDEEGDVRGLINPMKGYRRQGRAQRPASHLPCRAEQQSEHKAKLHFQSTLSSLRSVPPAVLHAGLTSVILFF